MAETIEEARAEFLNDCQFVARAPASYYWAGEYADLYGQLAVVHAIPLYAYVGIAPGGRNEFTFEFNELDPHPSIDPASRTAKNVVKKRRDQVTNRMAKYLEFWRRRNGQDYFTMKFWSEIPSRCGLNASGAAAAAIAALLQVLESSENDRKTLLQDIRSWEGKPVEELRENAMFRAVFRKGWILDDCAHNFLSSGTGPFSSLIGSPNGDLVLYFTEIKGFDSTHPVGHLVPNAAELEVKDYEHIEENTNRITWWGRRFPLRHDLREWLGVALVHSGHLEDTGNIFAKLERSWNVSWEDLRSCFSNLFPKLNTPAKTVSPIRDFLNSRIKPPSGAKSYAGSVFGTSLGLLSWILLQALHKGDKEGILSHVTEINKFLYFLGVVPQEIGESYDAVGKGRGLAIKMAGMGGGDFVVFGRESSIESLGSCVDSKYPVHYATSAMGWEAKGLMIMGCPNMAKPLEYSLNAKDEKSFFEMWTEDSHVYGSEQDHRGSWAKEPPPENKTLVWIDRIANNFSVYKGGRRRNIKISGDNLNFLCEFLRNFNNLIHKNDLETISVNIDQVVDHMHKATHGVLKYFIETQIGEGRVLKACSMRNKNRKFTFRLIEPRGGPARNSRQNVS